MLFLKIAAGLLVGGLIMKGIRRRRWRRHMMMGMHGHGHFGHGGFGHGGFGRGFGPPWMRRGGMLLRVARELELDDSQWTALEESWLSVREAMGSTRVARVRDLSALLDAATAEPLDRARLDEIAARHADAHAKTGHAIADAVARAHEVLRPEQRDKLRKLVARFAGGVGFGGFGFGGGGSGGAGFATPGVNAGPYR